MALTSGTKLGPYGSQSQWGAGGRGEDGGLWEGGAGGGGGGGYGIWIEATVVYRDGDDERAEPAEPPDHGGKHHWDDSIHVAGADRRQRSRRPVGHICVWRCAL